MSEVCPDFQQS